MIRSLISLVLGLQISAGPKAAQKSLTITISAEAATIADGSQIPYELKVANHSNHKIDCNYNPDWPGTPSALYLEEITDMKGNIIPHKLFKAWMGSEHPCTINPGETRSFEPTVVPSYYPDLAPGQYRFRVSIQNPDNPNAERIYSNAITFTIQPDPALPPKLMRYTKETRLKEYQE